MIAFIKGTVKSLSDKKLTVETSDIGYEINICEHSLSKLSLNETALIFVESSFSIYEGQKLYGFLSEEEKEIFNLFRDNIPNTGAKKSLEYLNKALRSTADFKKALIQRDTAILTAMFGFTKKTAEKLCDSLKDKIKLLPEETGSRSSISPKLYESALNALISLGYKSAESKQTLKEVLEQTGEEAESLEKILKKSLKKLSGGL